MKSWVKEHQAASLSILFLLSLAIGWVIALSLSNKYSHAFYYIKGFDIKYSAYFSIFFCFLLYLLSGCIFFSTIMDPRWKAVFLLLATALLATYFVKDVVEQSLPALTGKATIDFPGFYYAAKGALEGINIYDHTAIVKLAGKEMSGCFIWPFVYHPLAVLIYIPFAVFSYFVAQNLFLVFTHCLVPIFIAAGWSTVQLFRERKIEYALVTMLLLIMYFPIDFNFICSQNSIVVTLCILLAYLFDKKEAYFSSSIFLTASILIRQMPILFIIFFLLRGRKRTVFYTLALLAGATMAAYALFGSETVSSYIRLMMSSRYLEPPPYVETPAHYINYSLNAFFTRVFIPNQFTKPIINNEALGALLCYSSVLFILIVSYSSQWRRVAREKELSDIKFNLLLVTLLLIEPYAYEHHLVYAFLPCVFVIVTALSFRMKRAWIFTAVSLTAIFLISLRPMSVDAFTASGIGVFFISVKFWGIVLLWLSLFYLQYACLKELPPYGVLEIPCD